MLPQQPQNNVVDMNSGSSNYYGSSYGSYSSQSVVQPPVNNQPVEPATSDFTAENRSNMWDSIRNDNSEDDLDVPPSLRDRLRGKGKE